MVFVNYYDLINLVRKIFENIAIVGARTVFLTGVRPLADKFVNTEYVYTSSKRSGTREACRHVDGTPEISSFRVG
jgi:hypothetical protein